MNTKKILSIILMAVMLILLVIPNASASNYEIAYEPLPQVKEGYNRYFFLAPDDWFNEQTDSIGIYWWEGTDSQTAFPGIKAKKADAENVYYYDIPEDVKTIIWNNYIEVPDPIDLPMHQFARRTALIHTQDNKGKISVVRPNWQDTANFDEWYPPCDWYYYYGEGEYGVAPLEYVNEFEKALNGLKQMYPDNNFGFVEEIAPNFYPEIFAAKVMPWGYYNMLYAHNENSESTPDYVVFVGCFGGADQAFITEQFGDYLVTHHETHSLYELAHFVYVPAEQRVYTLKEAYESENLDISDAFASGCVGRHRGDANLDNEFNIKDATYIQKFLVQIEGYKNTGFLNFDNTGNVNIKDATAIQKYLAGIAE